MIFACIRRFSKFCQGCGTAFQHSEINLEGYIQETKYKNLLTQNSKVQQILEDIKYNDEIKLKDFRPRKRTSELAYEELDNIEDIEERVKIAVPLHDYQKKPKIRPLICMRCFKINEYGSLTETDCNINHRTPLQSLQEIFEPIKYNSIILKVVDILDFNGSFIQEICEFATQKNTHMILVINKIDALPTGYKPTRILQWCIQETKGMFNEFSVCPVSSKTGEGLDRVLKIMKSLKHKHPQSKFYVIGATNSGKSSLINKLSKICWNLPEEKYKRPLYTLTTSPFPGTTLTPIEIFLRSLDIRIIDTPGIPTISQLVFKLKPQDIKNLIPSKKINPVVLISKPEFSFWMGALVRIDMIEGNFFYLTFFTSNLCSIHKTKRELVEDVYNRQSGKLLYPAYVDTVDWEKHRIEIECRDTNRASKDLVIHGLGWVSITGQGKGVFEVYLAKGVGFNVREPLMPFEAHTHKVPNTKGKTINSEKINRLNKSHLVN
jgi:30S ribosome assembly GTPase